MNSPHRIYNDPLLIQKRKGTIDDPFTKIIEPVMIVKGKVQLREIPNRFDRVRVSGEGINWKEVASDNTKEIRQNAFIVNYLEGVVTFNSMHDGKTLTFTYTGEGVHYFPDSRIYLTKDQNFVSMADKLEDVDRLIEEQKSRVDEQIRSVPQPSEVVDQRIDRNGEIFRTAKDRVDSEQKKIEDAYKDMHNQRFSSLKSRIDAEQRKIEDAHVDLNSNVFFTLKDRIDNEQRKIEESLDDGKGTVFPSLKARIKNFDDRISDFEQNIESVEDRLTLKVDRTDLNGENLVALIELSPEGVLLSGRKIDMNGIISINDLDSEVYQKVSNAITASNINLTGSLATSVRMDQNGITAYTSDQNKFARFNADGLYAKNGAVTIERPDGYKIVDNGVFHYGFEIVGSTPSFTSPSVEISSWFFRTQRTNFQYCQFYSFKHDSRYIKFQLSLFSGTEGAGARMEVLDINHQTVASVTRYSAVESEAILTVDLGAPNGSVKSVYVTMNSGSNTSYAYGRIIRAWKEG